MRPYRLLALLMLVSQPTIADHAGALTCTVDGSRDQFVVYPSQQVFNSEAFSYYQMIDGLTVLVVNNPSLRFNRLSNLNLLPQSTLDPHKPAEKAQFFSGQCAANP